MTARAAPDPGRRWKGMMVARDPVRTEGAAHRRLLLLVVVTGVAVDIATKLVGSHLLAGRDVHLVGPLWLRLVHNPGVAFGLAAGAPAWLMFSLTAAVTAVLAASAWRGSALAAGLVLAGAVANLADRLVGGTVVDLFDVGWWPTFNLADVFITLGVALLILGSGRGDSRSEEGDDG